MDLTHQGVMTIGLRTNRIVPTDESLLPTFRYIFYDFDFFSVRHTIYADSFGEAIRITPIFQLWTW